MGTSSLTPTHPVPLAAPDAPTHPPGRGRIPALDAWRGMAISLLLVGHFTPTWRINCGRLGVELFFVLSGFLMGGLLFVQGTPLDIFYRRRVSRIFPAAYAFLGAWLFLGLAGVSGVVPNGAGSASCVLFYVNYFLALQPGASLGLPADHFWSLCVEEHAYVALSLLALVHRRSRVSPPALLVAALALCLANAARLGVAHGWDYRAVYWRSDVRGASILLGALAACLAARGVGGRSAYFRVRSDLLGLLLLAAGVALNTSRVPDPVKYSAGSALLAASLLLVARHADASSRAARPLIWLGMVSYSLYLWQQPFYLAMRRGELAPPLALGGALAAGLASFWLVERPARRRLNTIWSGSGDHGTPRVRG